MTSVNLVTISFIQVVAFTSLRKKMVLVYLCTALVPIVIECVYYKSVRDRGKNKPESKYTGLLL